MELLARCVRPVHAADLVDVAEAFGDQQRGVGAVAHTPGLYTVLGPCAMTAELRGGRLQTSKLVKPDLFRHVTLALPRQGKLTPACRVVVDVVQQRTEAWGHQLVELQ